MRGSIVPVLDLRAKFGLPMAEAAVDTSIIIMETSLGDKITVLGAIADSFNDVVELESGQIEKAPSPGESWRSEFINGIGKKGDQFIILLDVDRRGRVMHESVETDDFRKEVLRDKRPVLLAA